MTPKVQVTILQPMGNMVWFGTRSILQTLVIVANVKKLGSFYIKIKFLDSLEK